MLGSLFLSQILAASMNLEQGEMSKYVMHSINENFYIAN